MTLYDKMLFENTIEEPCILSNIISKLNYNDLKSLILLSKDGRFQKTISDIGNYISKYLKEKNRVENNILVHIKNFENAKTILSKNILLNSCMDYIKDNMTVLEHDKEFNIALKEKMFEMIKKPHFKMIGLKYLKEIYNLEYN